MTIRYALKSDSSAAERLRFEARQDGEQAAKFARPSEVDFDVLQRDALAVMARHCGETAAGRAAGAPVQFRYRDGGEYVDDWARGSQIFISGYMEGYLNAALEVAGRNLPIHSIPIMVFGVSGVLRRSAGKFTAVIRLGENKQPYTARAASAVDAISDVAFHLSTRESR